MNSANRSEIKIESFNHTRILNGLMRKKIGVLGCVKQLKLLTIVIYTKDLAAVKEYFEENEYNYIISKQMGAYHIAKKTLKRYGILVGLVISIALLVVASSMLIDINISGLENVQCEEILEIIRENNIKKYMFKSKINLTELNHSICKHDRVASASLHIKGVNLNINIQEELPKEEYFAGSEKGIFAMYDTIITKIVVESGTAVVKVGDTVKAGALLIAPYYNLDEENIVATPSRGEVFGRIWLKENIYFYTEQGEKVKTDKVRTVSELYIGGQLVGKLATSPYLDYEKSIRKVELNTIIPITIYYNTFYELEEKLVLRDFEGEKDMLIADKEREIEKNIDIDKTVIRKWNIIKNIDKTYIISIYYELEGRIDAQLTKGELNANRDISHRK